MMVYVWGYRNENQQVIPPRLPSACKRRSSRCPLPIGAVVVLLPKATFALQMSFLGIFNFTAPYLPWMLLERRR